MSTKKCLVADVSGNSIIYHEKQIRELCALHALNNLFQENKEGGTYTKNNLDEICRNLSPNGWINPHRSVLGLGNYDINVIMAALQLRGFSAIWFDKRKNPTCIDTTQIFGFILNVPTDYKIGFVSLPLKRRHWIAVRKINEQYWNLDSKFDTPKPLGKEDDLMKYLTEELQSHERELFIVVTNDVEKEQRWLIKQQTEIDNCTSSLSKIIAPPEADIESSGSA